MICVSKKHTVLLYTECSHAQSIGSQHSANQRCMQSKCFEDSLIVETTRYLFQQPNTALDAVWFTFNSDCIATIVIDELVSQPHHITSTEMKQK